MVPGGIMQTEEVERRDEYCKKPSLQKQHIPIKHNDVCLAVFLSYVKKEILIACQLDLALNLLTHRCLR